MFSDCISCRGSIELEEKKAIEGDDEFFFVCDRGRVSNHSRPVALMKNCDVYL